MERAGDRQEKMAGYCSAGQSPQRAVVLMVAEEDISQQVFKAKVLTVLKVLTVGLPGYDAVQCGFYFTVFQSNLYIQNKMW